MAATLLALALLLLVASVRGWKPVAENRRVLSLAKVQKLWLVRPGAHPPAEHVVAYTGRGTFLVRSASLDGYDGDYMPLEHAHKVPERINATLGVVVRVTHHPLAGIASVALSPHRAYVAPPVTAAMLKRLGAARNVVWVHGVRSATHHSSPSRNELVAAPLAPPFGAGGAFLISDTGLYPSHCAFAASPPTLNLPLTGDLPAFAPAPKVIGIMTFEYAPGQSTTGGSSYGSHGTSTASVAAGLRCNGNVGVANASSFLFMDITSPSGGLVVPTDWTRAFAVATQLNLTAHSVSWGYTYPDGVYDDVSAQFDEDAYANDRLPVCSAGNQGPFPPASPCTCKNCLSVGAGFSDPRYVASFSSGGYLADGRISPLVIALGVQVPVAVAGTADQYYTAAGTSFAAPGIEALVQLVMGWFAEQTGQRLSAAGAKAGVIANARPTLATQTLDGATTSAVDLSYGVPLLDLTNLLILDNVTLVEGARYSACFNATGEFGATLAWMDPPAAPFANPTLVNDLDLVVFAGGEALTADNHLDVTERVLGSGAGRVRVVVSASALLAPGQQRFSRALTGLQPAAGDCGTCLYGDACGAGQVMLCDAGSGAGTCIQDNCASGTAWNGTACSAAAGPPCTLSHGSGILVGGACLPQVCDVNYYLKDAACVCLPEVFCPYAEVFVPCSANAFPACPPAKQQQAPPQLVLHSTTAINTVSGSLGAIAILLLLGVLCCLVCEDQPKPPPSSPKPTAPTGLRARPARRGFRALVF